MAASGATAVPEAHQAVDIGAIIVLIRMLIVVAMLRPSGFFALATARVAVRGAVIVLAGTIPTFRVSGATCRAVSRPVRAVTPAQLRDPVRDRPALATAPCGPDVAAVRAGRGPPSSSAPDQERDVVRGLTPSTWAIV